MHYVIITNKYIVLESQGMRNTVRKPSPCTYATKKTLSFTWDSFEATATWKQYHHNQAALDVHD